MDTFIGLRAHYADDHVCRFAALLSRAVPCEFAVLMDETGGPQNEFWLPTLSITTDTLDRLGLVRDCEAPTWRCGDYSLYLALERYPHCRYFWLIEPDVRIHFTDIGDFFSLYAGDPTDLLAAGFRIAKPSWDWHESMAWYSPTVYRCLFSAVRLSRRALTHLLSERRRIRETRPAASRWPNDEAFVATVLASGDFKCRDLNDAHRAVYSERTFTYSRPIAQSDFVEREPDGQIYHPVLSGDRLFRKILRDAQYGRRDVRGANDTIRRLTGREWDETDAARYLAEIDAACKPESGLRAIQARWLRWTYRE